MLRILHDNARRSQISDEVHATVCQKRNPAEKCNICKEKWLTEEVLERCKLDYFSLLAAEFAC
jgi:hypothetical protein